MPKATGPSEIQPDAWEPDASTVDDVNNLLDAVTTHMHDRTSGETFIECKVCGEVDGHDAQCFVPLMKRWIEGDANGFTIHLTGEEAHRLDHCLDVARAEFDNTAAMLQREAPASIRSLTTDASVIAAFHRYAREARQLQSKIRA